MSGETILKIGTPKTLEANGASIVNNALEQADDATYSVASDGAYYPDAKFVLAATFGTAPTEGPEAVASPTAEAERGGRGGGR